MNLQKQPKLPKLPKCKVCKQGFEKRISTQQVCAYHVNPNCSIEFGKQKTIKDSAKQAKEERMAHRAAKVKAKRRGEWIAEAQTAVNKFIKLRDKDLPCISCGEHRSSYDAGHYLARSIRPELRFNEDNIHKQCVYCNNYNKGRAAGEYRPRLISRIGLERVEYLENPHPPAKWTIPELIEIKRIYTEKAKLLKT